MECIDSLQKILQNVQAARVCMRTCVCVCVCVRARARVYALDVRCVYERVYVSACVGARARVCVCLCAHARVCVCMFLCACASVT